ncbi:MAG TPA: tetratricopeptide repeat protein, partial [Phytomonospora sp.]
EKTAYGNASPEVGERLCQYGTLLKEMGDRRAAVDAFEQALPILEHGGPARRSDVVAVLGALGSLHVEDSQPRVATGYLQRALPMAESQFGRTDPRVGVILHDLALAKHQQYARGEAKDLMTRALAIFEGRLGAADKRTRACRTTLAAWR